MSLLNLTGSKLREEQWHCEESSAWITREGLGVLSHQTLYQHFYREEATGGGLQLHVRHRYKADRKRVSGPERPGRLED